MELTTLIVIACVLMASGALCWALPTWAARLKVRRETESQVRTELQVFETALSEIERRLQLLEGHAVDYSNSLGPEGTQRIKYIRSTLATVKRAFGEAEKISRKRTIPALENALAILEGNAAILVETKRDTAHPEYNQYRVPKEWKENLDELLQQIGEEVAEAAVDIRKLGSRGKSLDSPGETVRDLSEAGIDVEELVKAEKAKKWRLF